MDTNFDNRDPDKGTYRKGSNHPATLKSSFTNSSVSKQKVSKDFKRAARMKKIIESKRNFPDLSDQEIATMLGINQNTLREDIKALTKKLTVASREEFMINREIVLREIQEKMDYCDGRLKALELEKKYYPTQGARLIEEWGKLMDKKIKILGLNSPETAIIVDTAQKIDKSARDRAVDVMLMSIEDNVIEIETTSPKNITPNG